MRTFTAQDISEHRNYHPVFRLISIDGELPIYPKIGDILSQWDIEAMIYNGCRIILEPRNLV